MSRLLTTLTAGALALALSACAASTTGSGTITYQGSPEERLITFTLYHLFRYSDFLEPLEGVSAVCVGDGRDARVQVPMSVVLPLQPRYPIVQHATSCQRRGDPGPGLSITTGDGLPAVLLGVELQDFGTRIEVLVTQARTGMDLRRAVCRLENISRRDEFAGWRERFRTVDWRVRGC